MIPPSWTQPEFNQFAEGGVVPGPIGKAQPALVHGGEVVLTPEQARAIGGGTTGDLHIHVSIDGRQVMGTLVVPLNEAIASGQVRIGRQH